MDCGFVPRCALEDDDSSQIRIDKIFRIIGQCQYSIHDVSRTEIDKNTKLPRFNMPLELGICLGAKRFGNGKQKVKKALILDHTPYRYQAFISDIAGQDIQAHDGEPKVVIRRIRDWLRTASRRKTIPGAHIIWNRYREFQEAIPVLCKKLERDEKNLIFSDYTEIAYVWLSEKDRTIKRLKR